MELKRFDVIRTDHKNLGECIGIVRRTYVSGGTPGAQVVGVSKEGTTFEIYVDPKKVELLWREEEKATSETQG